MTEEIAKQLMIGQAQLGALRVPGQSVVSLRSCVQEWEPSTAGLYRDAQECGQVRVGLQRTEDLLSVHTSRAAPGWPTLKQEQPSSSEMCALSRQVFWQICSAERQSPPEMQIAVFPNERRVVINRQGAFVPQGLFGAGTTLTHELDRTQEGDLVIVIRALGRKRRHMVTRRSDRRVLTPEQRWIADHREEFAGRWVALQGESLITAGGTAREVYDAARALGILSPFVIQVEGLSEVPFAGW